MLFSKGLGSDRERIELEISKLRRSDTNGSRELGILHGVRLVEESFTITSDFWYMPHVFCK